MRILADVVQIFTSKLRHLIYCFFDRGIESLTASKKKINNEEDSKETINTINAVRQTRDHVRGVSSHDDVVRDLEKHTLFSLGRFSSFPERISSLDGGNIFVSSALPIFLTMERLSKNLELHTLTSKMLMVKLIRKYMDDLSQFDFIEPKKIRDASYLICTYLDERANDVAQTSNSVRWMGQQSLLIEFHQNSWGGEEAFKDLDYWLQRAEESNDILRVYAVILSLGWKGRYKVMVNGDLHLDRLRRGLCDRLLKRSNSFSLDKMEAYSGIGQSQAAFSWRKTLVSVGIIILFYGGFYLYLARETDPVVAAIESIDGLYTSNNVDNYSIIHPLLKVVIAEPWVTFSGTDDGYKIKFYVDKAFNSGEERFDEEFSSKFNRLARALSYWEGGILVIGHTDSVGIKTTRFDSNQALSEARARYVAEKIQQARSLYSFNNVSFSPGVVQYRGEADRLPIYLGSDPSLLFLNRRVEIFLKNN